MFLHVPAHFFNVLIFEAIEDIRGKDIAGPDPVRILASGDMADGDISVRERADNVARFADREETDIDQAHFFRGIFDAGIGFDAFHVAAHDFADFHDGDPPKSIDAVYVYMERNLLKKHWFAILNDLKERWPDLNQSDLDYIGGDVGKLVEVVQNRKHISAENACEDVEEFLSRLNIRQRLA